MVIQLLLYFTLLYTFLGDFLNVDFYVDDNDGAFDRTLEKYWLLRVILSSDVIVKFLVGLTDFPIAVIWPIAVPGAIGIILPNISLRQFIWAVRLRYTTICWPGR